MNLNLPLRYRTSIGAASSYHWNPHNLEGPWYGLWSLVLHDLVNGLYDLIVMPQYPIVLPPDSEPDGDESLDGGNHDLVLDDDEGSRASDEQEAAPEPQEEVAEPEIHVRRESDDDDTDCAQFDLSFESTDTVPLTDNRLIPDFVILHFVTEPLAPAAPRFNRRAGLGIKHECCPVIIECKRAPSRPLEGQERAEALAFLISEAQADLEKQCAYAFRKYSHSLSLMAVATSGDYWSYARVQFDMVPSLVDAYGGPQSRWEELRWWSPVRVGTADSDAYLAEIRHYLVMNKSRVFRDNP
jgi:hypothetical protein